MCIFVLSSSYIIQNSDQTCFVPFERVYDCEDGVSLTELECEEKGCCYNASASVQCYYPSGTLMSNDYNKVLVTMHHL